MALTDKNIDPGLMQRGSVPVPDPTLLTTKQIEQQIAWLKELIETRFKEQEKAVKLLQEFSNAEPKIGEVALQVSSLATLTDERFRSVYRQFGEHNARLDRYVIDSKALLDSQMTSAKEAVAEQNKSNAAAIAKAETNVGNEITSIKQRIDELRDTVGKREGQSTGANNLWGVIAGVSGLLVGLIGAGTAIIAITIK